MKPPALGITLALCLTLAGCADRTVRLLYVPPVPALPPAGTSRVTLVVLPFADQRGTEGDNDPYRVGGIYGGYGNRIAKVMMAEPWPPQLQSALVAQFRAAGVRAVAEERPPREPLAVLEGDVRNFSTEARWGRQAHISANIRLRGPNRQLLVQKQIAATGDGYNLNNYDANYLERLLNIAFAEFVQKVASDPDVLAALRMVDAHGAR